VNHDNSFIYFGKNVHSNVRVEIKEMLQVQTESLNEKYFGLPSHVGTTKIGAFAYLKDRVWKRLQGWLEKILSIERKKYL
jgi:hypothetical protein